MPKPRTVVLMTREMQDRVFSEHHLARLVIDQTALLGKLGSIGGNQRLQRHKAPKQADVDHE